MKVRWGSTYVMLNHLDSNKKVWPTSMCYAQRHKCLKICLLFYQFVNEFVYELGVHTENLEACKKIDALMLSELEWECVSMFCTLLSVSISTLALPLQQLLTVDA